MADWRNWSGKQQASPRSLRFARSEEDLVALVEEAAHAGLPVRVAGAGHSHAPLVPTDGIVVDLSGLAGVVSADPQRRSAVVRAGTPIHTLGRPLHDHGLALINQGDIDRQSIAGACATGTHGTGTELESLSAAVLGARLVLASGEIVECSADERPELWQAARLSLGAVGIVTRLTLQLRDAYRLRERGWTEAFAELLPKLPDLAGASRHFEFFWYPREDHAVAKAIVETDEPARYPLAEEGARCAWNYEVLPNHRPHRHTEMEYSVPAGAGAECFTEIRALIRREFPDLRWPVEYRTLAEDDVWLSMACGRPTVTISVHQDVREDERPYFAACEAVFRQFGGRPHWGKLNYLNGDDFATLYPRWRQWWEVRDRVDPERRFLNAYLRELQP